MKAGDHMDSRREKREQAFLLFQQGKKLIEIAALLGVPDGTVRRWKCVDRWGEQTNANDANSLKSERLMKKLGQIASDVQKVMNNPALTDKQRLFCLYYVRYFNATKAYQRAYECSYDVAHAHGYELLRNVAVQEEVERLRKDRTKQVLLQSEDVFQKFIDIAFADITDYVTFGEKEVSVVENDPDTGEEVVRKKIVNAVSFHESETVDGSLIAEIRSGGDGITIKLLDRMKALEWLADHMNYLSPAQRAKIDLYTAETEKINRQIRAEDGEGVIIINDAPQK